MNVWSYLTDVAPCLKVPYITIAWSGRWIGSLTEEKRPRVDVDVDSIRLGDE